MLRRIRCCNVYCVPIGLYETQCLSEIKTLLTELTALEGFRKDRVVSRGRDSVKSVSRLLKCNPFF